MSGFRAAVLTSSDRCHRGEKTDESGPALAELLASDGFEVAAQDLLPDEQGLIERWLVEKSDGEGLDLLATTGGTGFSPRDVAVEATVAVCDKVLPGLGEAMRAQSLKVTPLAMLSRQTAGFRGQTLIVNFPGSPKAVRECYAVVRPVLRHAIEMVRGIAAEHKPAPAAGDAR